MTSARTLLLVTAALALPACKSQPAKVCQKIDQLAAHAAANGDEKTKKLAQGFQSESSTCLTRMNAMQQRDADKFATASSCIEEATELRGVVKCFFEAEVGKSAAGDAKGDAEKK